MRIKIRSVTIAINDSQTRALRFDHLKSNCIRATLLENDACMWAKDFEVYGINSDTEAAVKEIAMQAFGSWKHISGDVRPGCEYNTVQTLRDYVLSTAAA